MSFLSAILHTYWLCDLVSLSTCGHLCLALKPSLLLLLAVRCLLTCCRAAGLVACSLGHLSSV